MTDREYIYSLCLFVLLYLSWYISCLSPRSRLFSTISALLGCVIICWPTEYD